MDTPPVRTAPTAHPIAPILAARWSPRSFADRRVPTEALRSVLEAARWAASCNNGQPWNYLVTRRHEDADAFAKLLDCLTPGNQLWAGKAPVLMLSVAQMHFAQNGNPNRHAWHDVGQASANLAAEAASLGLQAHQMAGFDPTKARTAFGIPDGFEPVAAIALGYPGRPDALPEPQRSRETAPRQRRAIEEFTHVGAWGAFRAP